MRLLLCLFIWIGMPLTATAQNRVALVIGNSAYDASSGGQLPNPVKDADTVAAALREIGFDVNLLKDLDFQGTRRALRDHRVKLEAAGPGTISFFYYAGHGANDSEGKHGGANYLIPVGARLQSVRDLSIEAVELGDAIDAFSRAAVSFVVFDACRNFPFSSSAVRSATRGFMPEREVRGTFIAFSSEPGSVALDESGYAQALADALQTPGANHTDIFKQVRAQIYDRTNAEQFAWFRDGILGDVVFREGVEYVNDPTSFGENAFPLWETFDDSSIERLENAPEAFFQNLFAAHPQEHVEIAAREGNTLAKYAVAWLNREEPSERERLLEESCEKGLIVACTDLYSERVVDKNSVTRAYRQNFDLSRGESVTGLTRSCAEGDKRACIYLVWLGESDNLIAGWHEDAMDRLSNQCDLNFRSACQLYSLAGGMRLNDAEISEKFFVQQSKRCERGEIYACYTAARTVLLHSKVFQDSQLSKALAMANTSCVWGDPDGCEMLAKFYMHGIGTPADIQESAELRSENCEINHYESCYNLAHAYENSKYGGRERQKAVQLYKIACDGGLAVGCTNLGTIYTHDEILNEDRKKAREYFKKGCDGNSMRGCAALGFYQVQGYGGPRNRDDGHANLVRACEGKDEWGCQMLKQNFPTR